MIFGYFGTPGSGKTYEAIRLILENLMKGKVVYTNIEGLDKPECREAIKYFCCISELALTQQLVVLDEEQVGEFWNHIPPKGILIVLDEAQNYFNARDWQSDANRQFGRWASTHRHNGHDLILISQRPERIDSAVRSLMEWSYFFRKINHFGRLIQKGYTCYAYQGDEAIGQPLETKPKRYDSRVFKCYKSYVADDVEEVEVRKHVNVLKHPVFYLIPVMICFTLYMVFFKSSIGTGDVFGTKKATEVAQKVKNKNQQPKNIRPNINAVVQESGVIKYSNR